MIDNNIIKNNDGLVPKSLFNKASKYLFGQGLIQVLNIVIAIFIIRILPVNEYSLYVMQTIFITSGGLLSNLGIGQGITTIGSFNEKDKEYISQVYLTAVNFSKRYYLITILGLLILSIILLINGSWSKSQFIIGLIFTFPSIWLINVIQNQKSVLYIKHDENKIFKAEFKGVLFRLLATSVCLLKQDAVLAIIGNSVGLFITKKSFDKYLQLKSPENKRAYTKKIRKELNDFINPLHLNSIYFGFQGYIAVLVLGFFGFKESIAELGALSRINSIFVLLGSLNVFIIQPYFAKIKNRKIFIEKLSLVFYYLLFISLAIIFIPAIFPNILSLILGDNYSGLDHEFIVSLFNSILIFINSALYFVNISRANTKRQYLIPLLGILLQFSFLSIFGINNTISALYFNSLPFIASIIIQILNISIFIINWEKDN